MSNELILIEKEYIVSLKLKTETFYNRPTYQGIEELLGIGTTLAPLEAATQVHTFDALVVAPKVLQTIELSKYLNKSHPTMLFQLPDYTIMEGLVRNIEAETDEIAMEPYNEIAVIWFHITGIIQNIYSSQDEIDIEEKEEPIKHLTFGNLVKRKVKVWKRKTYI